MMPACGARAMVAAIAVCCVPAGTLRAQTLRAAVWGTYEDVTDSDDWSNTGAQLTLVGARGHSAWVAAELLSRFGKWDAVERLGGTVHPTPRWWVTVELGSAATPAFMPKNTWELDVTAIVARAASAGLGYRRWNYAVGPVDVVLPHFTVQSRTASWDVRVSLSRNPSQRTDAAFYVRATVSGARRTSWWVLGGAGRESYLVGTAPAQVRSLETVTGAAGLRYNAGSGFTLRIDASVVGSRPVLSRRSVGVGVARQF
jgi:YaiO family outer membrane protein